MLITGFECILGELPSKKSTYYTEYNGNSYNPP
jgi:hypothetical protein